MKKNIPLIFLAFAILFGSCKKEEPDTTGTPSGGGTQTSNESPDFVTFNNGAIPSGWKTYTWEVDKKFGHNDNFALKSANSVATVFTTKTMKQEGFVEFYSYGDKISFYIDDVAMPKQSTIGSWSKSVYPLKPGLHTFKWQAEGIDRYIDDIKFYSAN